MPSCSALLLVGLLGILPADQDGWSEGSHGTGVAPDYALVFPEDSVNRIEIVLTSGAWQAIMEDMASLYGGFGEKSATQRPGPAGRPPPPFTSGSLLAPPPGAPPMPPPGVPMPGGIENPMWVEATVIFDGRIWEHVGIRFKGNSSLAFAWGAGSMKLPMKLDFDQFEDVYPETRDQRFHGFRQLSLSSNFMDPSLLREVATSEIFRTAGVPAPRTAFYRVYLDRGDGPVYFGLYTVVEMVEDTFIRELFPGGGGSAYKPEGSGATLAEGSFSKRSFDMEECGVWPPWSEIRTLYQALHAETRLSDPDRWRAGLEEALDVEGFILWLAVNTIVQNWDTYGRAPHNYYLCGDPGSGRLTWVPWDNNMSLSDNVGLIPVTDLDLADVGPEWPLVRYLMDDPVYRSTYLEDISRVLETAFRPEVLEARYRELHSLIAPFVTGGMGESRDYTLLEHQTDFETGLEDLVEHAFQRVEEVDLFLTEAGTQNNTEVISVDLGAPR